MLEARDRVGGRVEQVSVDDGRPVQLGGELVGQAHTAYLGLVEELGLTLTSTYTAVAGRDDVRPRRRRPPLRGRIPLRDARAARGLRARRAALRRARRHGRSRGSVVAPGRVSPRRRVLGDVAPLRGRAADDRARGRGRRARPRRGLERADVASRELRKAAAVGDTGFYSYDLWESLQVAEGSAEVALRMAARARRPYPARRRGHGDLGVVGRLPRPRSRAGRRFERRRSSARFRSAFSTGSRSTASPPSGSHRSARSATRRRPRS